MGNCKKYGDYLISNKKEPCIVCGKATGMIDIFSEQRVCSKKCQKAMNDDYDEYMKSIDESE